MAVRGRTRATSKRRVRLRHIYLEVSRKSAQPRTRFRPLVTANAQPDCVDRLTTVNTAPACMVERGSCNGGADEYAKSKADSAATDPAHAR